MLCKILLLTILFSLFIRESYSQRGTSSCYFEACSPDSGDILIGRGDRVFATSTCGVDRQETYIAPCGGEGSARPCTYTCDDSNPDTSHRPGNIALPYSSADVDQTWWQSSLGHEMVTLEINLEALFYFTHFIMTFKSPRPLSLLVEVSQDFGTTFKPYQYFADNCFTRFGLDTRDRPSDIADVICTSSYLEERNSREIVYRALPPHLDIPNVYSNRVKEKITLTNLRLTIDAYDLSALPPNANSSQYEYYALYSLVLRGWCFCNGHARECDPLEGVPQQPGMVNPVCRCIHNTMGQNCEECEPLYNDRPWKPGNPKTGASNRCRKCQCYEHAMSCHYDETLNSGVCDNCTNNTAGVNCEQCLPFYYRNTSVLLNDPDVCVECPCDPAGSLKEGECIRDDDNVRGYRSGQCLCKSNVNASEPFTTHCDTCLPGFFNLSVNNPDGCEACSCNSAGSVSLECDQDSGQCVCKPGVTGLKCDQCKLERCCLSPSNPEGCKLCNCDVGGSHNAMCNVDTGQCPCRSNITGLKCDTIPDGAYIDVVVTIEVEDKVDANTTTIINIGDSDGPPKGPFVIVLTTNSSVDVDLDPVGPSGYDVIVHFAIPNNTNVSDIAIDIVVNATNPVDPGEFPGGPCRNRENPILSTNSFTVSGENAVYNPRTGLYTVSVNGVCIDRNTNYTVTISYAPIDGESPPEIYVDKIDLIPDVRTFNFTTPTVDVDCSVPRPHAVCDVYNRTVDVNVTNTISVPCTNPVVVEDHLGDPQCSTVVKVAIIINNGSKPCDCDKHGSLSEGCSAIEGQCSCRPGFTGRGCDRCLPFYKRLSLDKCSECRCNLEGSHHEQCDINTGQCSCLPGINGTICDRCLDDHYNFGNPDGCIPCVCNRTGSVGVGCDGNGVCTCQPGVIGDKCDQCAPDHFGFSPLGCQPCDCDADGSLFTGSCDPDSGQCTCREGVSGRRCDQCETGSLGPSRTIDGYCIDCFCNGFSRRCGRGSGWYQAAVTYMFTEEEEVLNWTSNTQVAWRGDYLEFSTDFPTNDTALEVQFPDDVIGDKRLAYGHFLIMRLQLNQSQGTPLENTPILTIESSLNPYTSLRLEAKLKPLSDGLQSIVIPFLPASFERVDFLSFPSSEADLRKALANINSMKLIIHFEPDSVARQPTLDLHSFHFNYAVDNSSHPHATTPPTPAQFVEDCKCPQSRYGEFCQFCSDSFTRDPPRGGQFAKCVSCFCFGHADTCHPETGVCINCTANTAGDYCERCVSGYYRNYTSNTCEECRCFGGPGEPNHFTDQCSVNTNDEVICNCPEGFLQPDCGRCAPGYYGDPSQPDGNCRLCQCNNNSVSGGEGDPQCDSVRGVCYCVDPYVGDSCERCKDGYYGDATRQMCSVCDCDEVGTVEGTVCNHSTGQCECHENITGLRCDRCQLATYGLRTLGACPGCDCCLPGAASVNCTQDFGICTCQLGYTGDKCCDCDDGYHDNGEGQCIECNCPVGIGSALSEICNKSTGQCPCKEGVVGVKCDRCLPNTSGLLPLCEPCDECYDRWLDRITTFLNDVRVAVSIAQDLNITIVPVEDLFRLIRKINDTINRSRIDPEVYNATDLYMKNLTTFVRGLLDRGAEYMQRLMLANEDNVQLWETALGLNATLSSLVEKARMLNQSYPILDCEPFRLLVEAGLRRSDMAHDLVTSVVVNLTSNTSTYLTDYQDKRAERAYEKIKKTLEDMIIEVTDLFADYSTFLRDVTESLCGGDWSAECGQCGGPRCGFCSTVSDCGGLYGNATLALRSTTAARVLGEQLKMNLTVATSTLTALGKEIESLMSSVELTEEFVVELRKRVDLTHTMVAEILRVLNETSLFLQEVTPEIIAQLEEETLSYVLSRTPEEVRELLQELRKTLDAFPPWMDADNARLLETAQNIAADATDANLRALNVTDRADVVREVLVKQRSEADEVRDNLRMTKENMMEAKRKSKESTSHLVNTEGNLNSTEELLDRLEVSLADVKRRFVENERRLMEVQTTTNMTEQLAQSTQNSTEVLEERFQSLKRSASESAVTTEEDKRETTTLKERMENLNRNSLRQLTEVEDMLRRQNHLRHRQEQVKDDIMHIRIELEDLSLEINRNSFKNTGCQRFGGAG